MIKLARIHLISKTSVLKPLRKFVKRVAVQQQSSKKNTDDMVMAINEACMNVIQHAYNNADDEEIVIEFWRDKQDILIRIFDYAHAVDIDSIKSRDLEDVRPGGLGVHMIHQLMDAVEYKNNLSASGNILEMRKRLTPEN